MLQINEMNLNKITNINATITDTVDTQVKYWVYIDDKGLITFSTEKAEIWHVNQTDFLLSRDREPSLVIAKIEETIKYGLIMKSPSIRKDKAFNQICEDLAYEFWAAIKRLLM